MKKIVILLIALLFINIIMPTKSYAVETADTYVLIEQSTGQVLAQKNASEKRQAASLVQLMSMLLWAEDIKAGKYALNDTVTASENAEKVKGSSIWLVLGDTVTVEEILKSVAIASANDAAVALAEHASGSEVEFVKRMNAKAAELGMKNTKYTNVTGIDNDGQYTTALDTAILTRELMKYDLYNTYWLTWLAYVRGEKAQLVNTNRMVRYYEGIKGVKAGASDKAKSVISAVAQHGDMSLIAVVLGEKDNETAANKAESILDNGFASFEIFQPAYDTSKLTPIQVISGVKPNVEIKVANNGYAIIPKGKKDKIKYEYHFEESLLAPVAVNQKVGEVEIKLDDTVILSNEIITSEKVEELNFMMGVFLMLKSLFHV